MQSLQTPDGVAIAFNDSGSGKPFVFVHGWTLNQEMWDYHVHRLSASFRCVSYDRRGHGRSSMPDSGYDTDTLADDLALLLDHLDLSDVTLVSHSMGSGEVARYVSRHGSRRVSSVVMIAPGSPLASWAEDNPLGLTPDQVEQALDRLAYDRANWFHTQRSAYFALPAQAARTSEAMVDLTMQQCLQTPLPVQLACMTTMLTTDLRSDLAALDVPTTIVHGALDQSTPLETCGRPTAASCPSSELHVYDEAGHGIYITHRAEVEAELRRAAGELTLAS